MNYWLMKSEPDCFSLENLKKAKNQISSWDGVRNYQARNMLRDQMKVGDLAFFYYSSCTPPGIAGIIKIVKAGYPDFTAMDPNSDHFDAKSSPDNPIWFMVDVQFVKQFSQLISLEELKKHPALSGMRLLMKGNRLSVMPVEKEHWDIILSLP